MWVICAAHTDQERQPGSAFPARQQAHFLRFFPFKTMDQLGLRFTFIAKLKLCGLFQNSSFGGGSRILAWGSKELFPLLVPLLTSCMSTDQVTSLCLIHLYKQNVKNSCLLLIFKDFKEENCDHGRRVKISRQRMWC